MKEDYSYEPLTGDDWIRLLQILPAQERHASLKGELQAVRLTSGLEYEAVSYTWGDPIKSGSISFHGRHISLTANCTHAIRNLRRNYAPRLVWIDAICINQADKEEKGHEVSMMGSIYARATRTVVFLGPGDGTVHHLRAQKTLEQGSIGIQPGEEHNFEHARRNLLSRAWFRRKWIIQEVLLSRDLVVQCGKHEFSWAELETLNQHHEAYIIRIAKRYLHPSSKSAWRINGRDWDPKAKAAWEEMFEQGELIPLSTLQHTSSAANLSRYDKYRTQHAGFLMPPQLFDMLCTTSEFGCKEPRDRIFALLSLFARRLDIVPSYSCDEQQVYDSLSEQLIALGDTRLLWLTDRTSWRPNWATVLSALVNFIEEHADHNTTARQSTEVGRIWKELYRERQLGTTLSVSKGIWTTTGIRLGQISKIAVNVFSHRHIRPDTMHSGVNEHSLSQWVSAIESLHLQREEHESGDFPLAYLHQRNRRAVYWFRDWTLDIFGRPTSSQSSETDNSKGLRHAMAAQHGHVRFCRGMVMFTCDNELIGVAPADIRQGDTIYFLPGNSCPFAVLRQSDQAWTVVALCWFCPLKLVPSCAGKNLAVLDKANWETLKIV